MAASSSSELDQSLPRLRSNDPALASLDLTNNCIGQSGASALATALQHNSTLTSLNLRYNNIGASGASALATALQHNSSLTSLSLSYNNICASGATTLATALQHNSSLTNLYLYGNKISASGTSALATALQFNYFLTNLDFIFPSELDNQVKDILDRNKTNAVMKSCSLFELVLPNLCWEEGEEQANDWPLGDDKFDEMWGAENPFN